MKHPNREQWIDFLYEEGDATQKNELAAHLESCAECQQQVEAWRKTMSVLNRYRVEKKASSVSERTGIAAFRRTWLPLSAAAAIILAGGVILGAAVPSRAGGSQAQTVADLRARMEKSESENAQTQKTLAEMARTMAENHARDQAALVAMAQELKSTRKDLETVAALTQREFVRLASFTP